MGEKTVIAGIKNCFHFAQDFGCKGVMLRRFSMSPRKLATDPVILEMPAQKMAALRGVGAPDKVFADLMPALYGSVYTLKFARKKAGLPDFKVGACRARYPDAHLKPKDKWTIIMGLPIPEDVASLPQKVPGIEVRIETWQYGTVGQVE